jgi:hypothetical protein
MKTTYEAAGCLLAALLACGCKDKTDERRDEDPTAEELDAMRAESESLMPKTFSDVWVGMTEEDLATERPDAEFQPQRTDPERHKWYSETSATGVKVWYGVERETGRLGVVQFAHLFDSWVTFSSHATALLERFGTDYELYTCPAVGPADVAMTRLLWARQPLAVMEAVLEMGESVSVTMIVAPVAECRKGIEKQRCVRVDKEQALERWIEEQLDDHIEEHKEKIKCGKGGVTSPAEVMKRTEAGAGSEDGEGASSPPPDKGE